MTDINEAWAEAETHAPVNVETYHTIELQHPGIRDGEGNPIPLRYILDVEARLLGIEIGATFTPGEMALFEPTALQFDLPEQAEGRVPVSRLAIDNVSGALTPYLDAAIAYAADLKLIYRGYTADDLSSPAYGPMEFVLTNITVDGTRVEGTATISDFGDMSVPSLVYRADDFPGLQA